MKPIFLICFLLASFLISYSQDTVVLYLDNNYQQVKETKATICRIAILSPNLTIITDKFIDGRMINYGEYISINPWVENGTCKYYNMDGSLYSKGKYDNGRLIGKWEYYTGDKAVMVDYQISHDYYTYLRNTCILDIKEYHPRDTLFEEVKKNIIDFLYPQLKLPARTREIVPYYLVNADVIIDTDGTIKCPRIEDPNIDLIYESLRILALYKCDLSLNNPIRMVIPIIFNTSQKYIDYKGIVIGSESSDQANDGTWFVEENATFQGGDLNTFSKWVLSNIHYPYEAIKLGITGKVFAQFSVNTEGEVCDIKIVRSQYPSLDEESIRVLKNSPTWLPALQKGKPIKQNFVIPIAFNLY
jgi:TonB family protein